MVALDLDLDILTKYAYLFSSSDVNSSSDAQESQQASSSDGTKFYQQNGYNAKNLVEDLKLNDPKNRYALLKKLTYSQLMVIISKLDKKSLLMAMKFFTKDKLVKLLSKLPAKDLIETLQQVYSNKELMELLPSNAIDKFLNSYKIDKKDVMSYLGNMSPTELARMYEAATGKRVEQMDQESLLSKLNELPKEKFQTAVQSMPRDQKIGLATHLANNNEKLLQEIPKNDLFIVMMKTSKQELIKGMEQLDNSILVKLATNLPEELLTQVATLLDPETLASTMLEQFTNVLDQLG